MNQVSMSSAYVWALILGVVCFLLAVIIANLILFKPNNPGTGARRMWFWILGVASVVIGLIINFIKADGITVPSIQSDYQMHSAIAAGVCFALYVLIGLIVSKLAPNSKVGTWF